MWLPESAEEIERLAREGSLEETHSFEAKELLGRNRDLAVDVCAMTPGRPPLLRTRRDRQPEAHGTRGRCTHTRVSLDEPPMSLLG